MDSRSIPRRLGVAARHGIAHHHQIGPRLEMGGIEAHEGTDAGLLQERRHRRVEGAVRAPDLMAFILQKTGERRHASAANRDAVDVELAVQEMGRERRNRGEV
jgi:hypothetical protein